jgi:hypothetical protein
VGARRSLDRVRLHYPFCVSTDTQPPQPKEVTRAIAEALAGAEPVPDPWWQAGIEEALDE